VTVSIERKIQLSFGAALVVMIFAGASAWWNLQRFGGTFLLVDHTHQVLHHVDRALTGVLTMQTSTRGFVLTGDERMLDVYNKGGARVEESLRLLRDLTKDNVSQQRRLARILPIADQARTIMAGRIAARRERGLESISDVAAFLAGQEAVEGFRELLEAMAAEEKDLLHERLASTQAAGRSTLGTIIGAGVLATVFVVVSGLRVHRDFQRRRLAEEALQDLNDQLETRVRDRTAELAGANAAMKREMAERAEAQASLVASEQRLRNTLDGMLEGCQIIGKDFRYLYLNDTAVAHARNQRQTLLGRTMQECYPGVEQTEVFAETRRCLEQRTSSRFEQFFTFPDGTQAWFLVAIQPAPEGAAILSLDITERKVHEERIRQDNLTLEKRVRERTAQLEAVNRELEAFSYTVSHDLRAPLRHVDGFANLLNKHPGAVLDEKGKRFLATISTAARQMGRLIDDLLAFSRMGRTPLQLQQVDHGALVAAVIADGRYEQMGRAITWDITPLPTVPSDLALMRQVWANLIENAVKYTGRSPQAKISISAKAEIAHREVVFTISDNGVGFDMAYVDKLFGVFQRLHGPTEFEGTGIGLANVRRIVIRHGGRIWAEGHVGKGASFSFTLPSSVLPPPTAV
jgi:PAS domain S-box-containing protein